MPEHAFVSETLTIWSEGSRLAADIYYPENAEAAPAVVLCHGWGGTKAGLVPYGEKFAKAGFVALGFDYRGWGESDGRLVVSADSPMLTEAGERQLDVRVVREVVDPVDRVLDAQNALAYLRAQPMVDNNRIGLWGTSYGGGHVTYISAIDPGVKAMVAQIGGFGPPYAQWWNDLANQRWQDKATGALDVPIPQGIDSAPGLLGTPDVAKMLYYDPREVAPAIRAPALIIDAEDEELVDRHEHGEAVFNIVRQNVDARYETFPCKHYGMYDDYFEPATDLALEWFEKYL